MANPQPKHAHRCPKCKGKGMLPLKNKGGKIIPHAWVYCECYEEEPKCFYPLQPEDIDFPISYSYYRSLCQLHGWPDPGSCELPDVAVVSTEVYTQPTEKPKEKPIKRERYTIE